MVKHFALDGFRTFKCRQLCLPLFNPILTAAVILYDKKSDEGSNSVRMRPENSGGLKVVKK